MTFISLYARMMSHHTLGFQISVCPRLFQTRGVHGCTIFIVHGVRGVNITFPLWSHNKASKMENGFEMIFCAEKFFLEIIQNDMEVSLPGI